MVRIKSVRLLAWEDAFEVEFDDGFASQHKQARRGDVENRLQPQFL
jgi:hypothetical protein